MSTVSENNVSDPFTVLRSLDPAPASVDPHSPRARADLERILASDPGWGGASGPRAQQPRRPVRVPRLAAAAAAVAIGTGLALVPWSPGGGDVAYATWTAAPTALDAGERAEAADACRDAQADGAGSSYRQELDGSRTAIAERRGAWSLVLLAGKGGFSAMCVTDESRPIFRSSFGYVATEAAQSGGAPVSAIVLGVGSIDGNALSLAAGPAEPGVTAVTYTSPEHGRVSATVSGGHFAFWLPGDELEDAPSDGVAVEVEHADGTAETVTLRLS